MLDSLAMADPLGMQEFPQTLWAIVNRKTGREVLALYGTAWGIAVFSSLSRARGMIEAGASPALEGALVKELGGVFEQDIPRIAHDLVGAAPLAEGGSDFDQVLAYLTQASVAFSLRGGTREILRVIIARGLDLR